MVEVRFYDTTTLPILKNRLKAFFSAGERPCPKRWCDRKTESRKSNAVGAEDEQYS